MSTGSHHAAFALQRYTPATNPCIVAKHHTLIVIRIKSCHITIAIQVEAPRALFSIEHSRDCASHTHTLPYPHLGEEADSENHIVIYQGRC